MSRLVKVYALASATLAFGTLFKVPQVFADGPHYSQTEITADIMINGEKGFIKALYLKEYGYAILFPRLILGNNSSFISAGGTDPSTVCKLFGLKLGQFPESAVEFAPVKTPKVNFDANLNFRESKNGEVVYHWVRCWE